MVLLSGMDSGRSGFNDLITLPLDRRFDLQLVISNRHAVVRDAVHKDRATGRLFELAHAKVESLLRLRTSVGKPVKVLLVSCFSFCTSRYVNFLNFVFLFIYFNLCT